MLKRRRTFVISGGHFLEEKYWIPEKALIRRVSDENKLWYAGRHGPRIRPKLLAGSWTPE